jgi:uncharacterized protein YecE (DUF72 family)
MKKLRDPGAGIDHLVDRLEGLADRAGPILWQLPPGLGRDDDRLDQFLAALPGRWLHAVEFRHRSWLDGAVFERLHRAKVALCIPDGARIPQAIELTAPWTYLRFHRGGRDGAYTDAELDTWARRIRDWRRRGVDVWAYFNNDAHGYAIENAKVLLAKLGEEVKPDPTGPDAGRLKREAPRAG